MGLLQAIFIYSRVSASFDNIQDGISQNDLQDGGSVYGFSLINDNDMNLKGG